MFLGLTRLTVRVVESTWTLCPRLTAARNQNLGEHSGTRTYFNAYAGPRACTGATNAGFLNSTFALQNPAGIQSAHPPEEEENPHESLSSRASNRLRKFAVSIYHYFVLRSEYL